MVVNGKCDNILVVLFAHCDQCKECFFADAICNTKACRSQFASYHSDLCYCTGHTYAAGAFVAISHDYLIMRNKKGWFCFPEVNIKRSFTVGYMNLAKLVEVVYSNFQCMHSVIRKICLTFQMKVNKPFDSHFSCYATTPPTSIAHAEVTLVLLLVTVLLVLFFCTFKDQVLIFCNS